jgi:hypothetical protein
MDFHDQRSRDLIRSEGRPKALDVARKTRGLLTKYVSSRRMQVAGEPTVTILWGRIVLTGVAVIGGAALLVHALR